MLRGMALLAIVAGCGRLGFAPSPMVFGTGAVTTTSDRELLAAVGLGCGGYPNVVAWADNAGFTIRGDTVNTSVNQPGVAADRIVGAQGTYSDAWSYAYNGTQNLGAGAIATFR
jgi:hypothetical protein